MGNRTGCAALRLRRARRSPMVRCSCREAAAPRAERAENYYSNLKMRPQRKARARQRHNYLTCCPLVRFSHSPNQVLTHAARLWWPRAARAKGSGQSNFSHIGEHQRCCALVSCPRGPCLVPPGARKAKRRERRAEPSKEGRAAASHPGLPLRGSGPDLSHVETKILGWWQPPQKRHTTKNF